MHRASDLYEELVRLRSLLEFYRHYPFGCLKDGDIFEELIDLLERREREIIKQIADLQR